MVGTVFTAAGLAVMHVAGADGADFLAPPAEGGKGRATIRYMAHCDEALLVSRMQRVGRNTRVEAERA
jgi:hypothetical protein